MLGPRSSPIDAPVVVTLAPAAGVQLPTDAVGTPTDMAPGGGLRARAPTLGARCGAGPRLLPRPRWTSMKPGPETGTKREPAVGCGVIVRDEARRGKDDPSAVAAVTAENLLPYCVKGAATTRLGEIAPPAAYGAAAVISGPADTLLARADVITSTDWPTELEATDETTG